MGSLLVKEHAQHAAQRCSELERLSINRRLAFNTFPKMNAIFAGLGVLLLEKGGIDVYYIKIVTHSL